MKYPTYIAFLLLSCPQLTAQEIPILSFEELNEHIHSENQSEVLIVNFWATWCKPCIKELPYFDSLQSTYSTEEVKVLLVSLDIEVATAEKYSSQKNIISEVVYLDEVDHNSWIDRISPEWSGAIPATLFVSSSGSELFYEGELSKETLFSQVNQLLHPK
ncbi:MAG: TlpA family protein disulfide reductase [Cyclobacteriaceae bacterium]